MPTRMHAYCVGAVAGFVLTYATSASADTSCTCDAGQRLVKITGTGNTNVINDPFSAPASLGTTTINTDDGSIELICGVRGVILGNTPPIPFTSYIQCRDKLHSEVVLYTLLTFPNPADPTSFVEQTSAAAGGAPCGIEGRRGVFLGVTKGTVTISGTTVPAPDNGQFLQDWKVRGSVCLPRSR